MTYYPTLAEDLTRAKEILERGKAEHRLDLTMTLPRERVKALSGGTIYGGDTYAAYMLLESFVAAIEAVGPKVCELALRHERMRTGTVGATVTCPLCDWSARNEVDDDPEAAARIERHLQAAFTAHVARAHGAPE
jgi:hypothetical protein